MIEWLKHGFEKVVPQPVDSHSEVSVKKATGNGSGEGLSTRTFMNKVF